MKIKTKLALAILFLFVEFLIVSLFSLYFIFKISQQNNLITKDNNLSIGYSENMLQSMDKINDFNSSSIFNPHFVPDEKGLSLFLNNFEKNLVNEENNITETGEKELARSVRENFEKFKSLISDSVRKSIKDKSGYYYANLLPTVNEIKFALFAISDINMNAIIRKNMKANDTARHSYIVLSIIASISILVFFTFIFGFPKYIADPIEILVKNVTEVANNNFNIRMPFKADDEFGQISKAFNDIVVSLEEYNKFDTKILLERKELAESVIRMIDEPVILLDVNQNIILVSILAEKLLSLNHLDIINKSASEVAQKNDLLRFMLRSLIQDPNIQTNTFTLTADEIKTTYTSEMNLITKYNKNSDLIVPIGYKISLKKLSKTFD
jgi:nitrogen fixation/metabolism regulation signal transduction histidine kinase